MADVRTARRNAEKAARDALAGTLVGAAGELGAARATQQEAGAGVAAAAEKGRQVVEAAQLVEAAALLDRAQAQVAETDTGYASAWQGARDAGWAPAQLRGMGYPAPPALRIGPASHRQAKPPKRGRALLCCGGILTAPPLHGRRPRTRQPRALCGYTVAIGAVRPHSAACRYRCR